MIQKANPIYDIRAYSGACDNSTDNTAAFNSALSDAQTAGGGIIFFPLGICLFGSKPNNIGGGVKLQGQGWATNTAVGTSLIRNYADAGALGFITFDGSYSSAKGTGSGIDDMMIGPAVGQTGGYLVLLTSKPGCVVGSDCDNHRASDTHLTNVFLGNGNGGTSACGLYIDGSQNTTAGSQGIRIINVNNLRVSSTTTADCSIYMNNAVHFFGNNMEIDTGFGSTPGITVTGAGAAPNAAASAQVHLSNVELVGDLIIDSASDVETSGSVFVGGVTTISANTATSRLDGRFVTLPTNSSTTSTWTSVGAGVPLVVQGLCATSTGVCSGAAGEVGSVTAATTGVFFMGSDHTVTFNRFASTKIGFVGSMFCATTTCSSGANIGDIQAASAATAGAYWLGSDNLSFITRNAGGDVNVKQNLGFRSGSSFIGMFTAPLTASRTYTFPDGPAAGVMTVNFTTAGATTSDILAVTGMTASGHCWLSPSNALAATGMGADTTWLDTPGANVITLHHTNTNGQLFTVACTSI